MGKKRKSVRQPTGPTGPRDYDPADARLGPVTTYEDLANSEDEYFIDRDKIMLEDEPRQKRQKREDDFLEESDEEVLNFDDGSEDEEADVEEEDDRPTKAGKNTDYSDDEEMGDKKAEEEGDLGWWGSSRKEYYGNHDDNVLTEADALEEEAEALRLQKKKLSKMSDKDFLFDEDEWLAGPEDAAEGEGVVTEQLTGADLDIDEMTPGERSALVRSRYPELNPLCDELIDLYPQLEILEKEAQGKPSKSLEVIRWWVAGCYVSSLLSYFSILTSPARDGDESTKKLLDPAELREHEVMEVLVSCRETWQQVKSLHSTQVSTPVEKDLPLMITEDVPVRKNGDPVVTKLSKADKEAAKKKKAAAKAKAAKAKELEASLADLDSLITKPKKLSKSKHLPVVQAVDGDDSDFGEEDALDDRTLASKAQRKKSLRFYTSQIAQKASKRAEASKHAGGDDDIPHKERFRDRQARLTREAERRGLHGKGADLGDDSGDDAGPTNAEREDEDGYYDMVAAISGRKKADKAARAEALATAGRDDLLIPHEEIGEDGKRKITYAIEKNKGLTVKRKKENRNPRVKKRMKYEKQMKKLSSVRQVYKGGEGKSGYQGEVTGIKTGLVKSIKL